MDIRQLRYFIETAQHGNIQDTADILFVTRQAVSKTLMQLEKELGYPLFYRVHGGVILSEQGKRYYDRALAVVQSFDSLEAQMKQIQIREQLRIALPLTVHHYFYDRLEEFSRSHEDKMELILLGRTDSECHTLFESGTVDMAVSHLKFSSDADKDQIIAVSPLYYTMRKDHPLASRPYVTHQDLLGEHLIFYKNGYPRCFWLHEDTPKPAFAIDDILLAYELVEQGRGIFPVPLLSLPTLPDHLTLVPLKGHNDMDYFHCAIASHTENNPLLKKLCLDLRQALKDPSLA